MDGRTQDHPHTADERGQATTEYALVLLVAAVIALLAIGWATAGGGAGKIGGLLDTLLEGIIGRATEQL
ncbi:MAG: hypothetical protein ACKORY_03360 [Actinomycetota bacterium]